jgi:Mg2+ and Co2+ transporter CorA
MNKKIEIFDELIELTQNEIDKIQKDIYKIEDKNLSKKLERNIKNIEEIKKDLKDYYKLKKKNKKNI